MKIEKVLVTGGAGFIGSHTVDKLIEEGYQVRIIDNLDKQVHLKKPDYLNKKAQFIKGDVTREKDLKAALEGIDAVYHFAAVVGIGQSMYEIARYVYQNSFGTAQLLNFLANGTHQVKRIIVASSMSNYGEGLYNCKVCGPLRPSIRSDEQMRKKIWEPLCPQCGQKLTVLPTPESERFIYNSIYSITKQSQEDMAMVFGRAYGIPVTCFRFFNVYGPRQSLSNPYTGVTAIFLSRLKNNKKPIIFEDGNQTRDFISVYDLVDVNVRVLENDNTAGKIFNLGSGKPTSIKNIALITADLLSKKIKPEITGKFRSGDVRHCFADMKLLTSVLKWSPQWNFEKGMEDLVKWGKNQEAKDFFNRSTKELSMRSLLKS